MRKVGVRLATPDDAEMFASWAANNPGIPQEDIAAVAQAQPLVLVIEMDGKPEMYLPLIPAMTIGYLGFRPDQDVRTRARCLREMHGALQRLQSEIGIDRTYVHTKAEYPLGKWAIKNGFYEADNDAFILEKPYVL